MATPPAAAAICFIRLGCWGWAIADGGAAIGVEGGGGAALGAGAGGARATGALGGGDAARPRRGIFHSESTLCKVSAATGNDKWFIISAHTQ